MSGRGRAKIEGRHMAWPTTSRQSRGYGASWDKLRLVILKRDKYLCQPCRAKGVLTPATAVDHIKAKANGGTDDPGNLRAICDPCHKAKTAIDAGHKVKIEIGPDGWPV